MVFQEVSRKHSSLLDVSVIRPFDRANPPRKLTWRVLVIPFARRTSSIATPPTSRTTRISPHATFHFRPTTAIARPTCSAAAADKSLFAAQQTCSVVFNRLNTEHATRFSTSVPSGERHFVKTFRRRLASVRAHPRALFHIILIQRRAADATGARAHDYVVCSPCAWPAYYVRVRAA